MAHLYWLWQPEATGHPDVKKSRLFIRYWAMILENMIDMLPAIMTLHYSAALDALRHFDVRANLLMKRLWLKFVPLHQRTGPEVWPAHLPVIPRPSYLQNNIPSLHGMLHKTMLAQEEQLVREGETAEQVVDSEVRAEARQRAVLQMKEKAAKAKADKAAREAWARAVQEAKQKVIQHFTDRGLPKDERYCMEMSWAEAHGAWDDYAIVRDYHARKRANEAARQRKAEADQARVRRLEEEKKAKRKAAAAKRQRKVKMKMSD